MSKISSVINRSLHDKVVSKSCNVEVIRVWEWLSSCTKPSQSPSSDDWPTIFRSFVSGNDFPVGPNLLNLSFIWWFTKSVHSVHIHFSFYLFPQTWPTECQSQMKGQRVNIHLSKNFFSIVSHSNIHIQSSSHTFLNPIDEYDFDKNAKSKIYKRVWGNVSVST